MNESEHNFQDVKRLLKLKRHEVPPPGFFNHFSDEVISRIRAGEAQSAGSLAERLNDQAPWLVNFIRFFEAKPGVVGAFATSLCLLLLFGVVLAEHSETGPQNIFASEASQSPATLASVSAPAAVAATPDFGAATAVTDGGIAISTNSSLQPVATLFGQSGAASLFQPAGFAPGH
jgi:hypothetical protein